MPPQIDNHTLSLIISERMDALDYDSFSPADWNVLVHKAQAEGVGPLVYRVLSKSGEISFLPEALQHSLRAMYFSVRMNNEQIIGELESLAHLFERAGIPVVALKGICFALTIYPDIGLRPMVDLDLLVPASRISEAVEISRSLGYVDAAPEALPGLNDLLGHAVCLRKIRMPFTILELHKTLVAEGSFTHAVPVDWFWGQTEPLTFLLAGSERRIQNLRMLSPTAQLLYASAHSMLQHGGRNAALHWLYDMDRLVRAYRDRLDWDLLLEQARVFEWGSAISAALSRVIGLFDTPIPPGLIADLSNDSDRNQQRVASLQESPGTHTLEEYQKLKSLNWHGRFKLILALIAPGPAYMRWRYRLNSEWSLPFYYLYRWWEILIDAVKTVRLFMREAVVPAGNPERQLDRSPE